MEPIKPSLDKHLDILYLDRMVDLVSETMKEGYGEVIFRVVVKAGKVSLVSLTRTETHALN